jgi:uncharacterized membrane protein YukC
MFVALPLIAIGWIGYAIWLHKIREKEKTTGKPTSERLTKTRKEISDWAEKMKGHKSPREQALQRRRELEAQRRREKQEKQRESGN